MTPSIKTRELGKLRVYMTRNDKVESGKFINRIFPKKALKEIVEAAKKDGIMNANVFHSHSGYTKNGNIHSEHLEYDNAHLPLCLELIDEREKLEAFFKKHHIIFREKVVVYKTVEFWEAN